MERLTVVTGCHNSKSPQAEDNGGKLESCVVDERVSAVGVEAGNFRLFEIALNHSKERTDLIGGCCLAPYSLTFHSGPPNHHCRR